MDNNDSSLTTNKLKDMVLDHILSKPDLFLPKDDEQVRIFCEMMDSLSELALKVATASIANRHNLSPLKTLAGVIGVDPEQDTNGTEYELRYRIVAQNGNNPPHRDKLFTLEEAINEYGEYFVDNYWGQLGEHCPKRVTTNDETLWFTTVRYPVMDLTPTHRSRTQSSPTN